MYATVSISSKRQIVIPSKFFAALKFRKGQKLVAEIKDDTMVLTPAETLVNKAAGMIKVTKPVSNSELEQIIEEAKLRHFRKKYSLS
jgi:bifunctional DNA-binding transcriptional regulator/antitoxin component of YhaV-PrlF toxin-antitoxin module